MKQLVASIMCADQLNIDLELALLKKAGINWLHCDVMDGVFVNNLAMGPYQIEALRKVDGLTLDVHLATVEPEKYIEMFAPTKPDYLTFHIETTDTPKILIDQIKSHDIGVGLAISPDTSLSAIAPWLDQVDLILFMTVAPGFAGQAFRTDVLDKLKELDHLLSQLDKRPLIEVDGNIHGETIQLMSDSDVNLFVLGTSALFNKNPLTYIEKAEQLMTIIEGGA